MLGVPEEMRITAVRIAGPELVLSVEGREAATWAYGFKPGDYDIVPRKKKRSLDANGYAWVLIDKLAEATGYPKSEVYRNSIREVGGVSDVLCIKDEAQEMFCRAWSDKGLGWQTEVFPSKLPGCVNVTAYYGTSVYTTRQMSRLIDHLIEDCRALGIETLSPDRLQSLLEAWDGIPQK